MWCGRDLYGGWKAEQGPERRGWDRAQQPFLVPELPLQFGSISVFTCSPVDARLHIWVVPKPWLF